VHDQVDVVVVGAGVAGIATALAVTDMGHEVALIDPLGPGGRVVNLGEVELLPAVAPVPGMEFAGQLAELAMSSTALLRFDDVVSIEPGAVHVVQLTDGTIQAPVVVLAMGTSDAPLQVPGADVLQGRGVSYCVGCDGPMYKGAAVTVVGNGEHAANAALHLADLGNDVIMLFREQGLQCGRRTATALRGMRQISIMTGTEVTGLEEQGGRLAGIRLKRGVAEEVEPTTGLFFYGTELPRSQAVAGVVTLDEHGFIVTDANLSTDVDGIYAVGDLRAGSPRTIAAAATDGRLAAQSIEVRLSTRARRDVPS